MCEREKLLPCPCCSAGNPREYVHDSYLVIECTKCNLRIQRALSPSSEWEKGAIECRKAWNTRPEKKKGSIIFIGEYNNFSVNHTTGDMSFSHRSNCGERVRVIAERVGGEDG